MYGRPTITHRRTFEPKDGTWTSKFNLVGMDHNSEQDALKDLDTFNGNLKLKKEIESLRKQIQTARASLQTALAEQQ